jgi:hypothetical protein
MTPILRSSHPPVAGDPGGRVEERVDRRRFGLLWVAPIVLLLVAIALPLVFGAKTLYLRDVLNTHYEMKWTQAQAMREGRLPLIDLQRAGGQASLANPNTVPLYPDNLLFLFTESLWALNAHFWLHWLIAPFAGYWLGRSLGMRREAAWALGVVYVSSGFYLATLNLYNLVAPVTLAPALLAAGLDLADPSRRRRAFVLGAVLWALMILGGDPMTAAFTLLATLLIVLVTNGRRYPWLAGAGAVALGTGLAAPQWLEFLRILSFTYRGFWGFGYDLAEIGGWRPIDAVELLIPFFFGRPDINYWGEVWHAGQVPLFLTFYPGVLMLALMAAARGDGRRTLVWAWGLVGVGVFLALGEVNPLVVALSELPGASLLRIPSKLWSLVTLGSAVLCGLAFGRLFETDGRRRLVRPLLVLGLVFLVAWAAMSAWPGAVDSWGRALVPEEFEDGFVSAERLRWAGSCFLSLLLIGFYLLCLKVGARRAHLAALALLVVHAATQFFFLRPVIQTDERAPYLERPELMAEVPPGSRVVHGGNLRLFGSEASSSRVYPDARLFWRERRLHRELHPAFGVRGGLRYELNLSPEGLDSFLTRAVVQLFWTFEDTQRLQMLRSSGVEYLIVNRALDPSVGDQVELIVQQPSEEGEFHLYRVLDPAPPLAVVGRIRGSANLNEALTMVLSPLFDDREAVVLAGEHEPRDGRPGTARLIRETDESIEAAVSAPNPAALVVQRTHLPIYRATIDGEPTGLYAANLHRLAVKVPAGDHVVKIWVDRSPVLWGLLVALISAAALALLTWHGLPKILSLGAPVAPTTTR